MFLVEAWRGFVLTVRYDNEACCESAHVVVSRWSVRDTISINNGQGSSVCIISFHPVVVLVEISYVCLLV